MNQQLSLPAALHLAEVAVEQGAKLPIAEGSFSPTALPPRLQVHVKSSSVHVFSREPSRECGWYCFT